MKKLTAIFFKLLFTVVYTVFCSLGFVCFINILALKCFGGAEYYPIFTPFCVGLELLSLTTLCLIFWLNYKFSGKLGYKNLTWILQTLAVLAASVPMIWFWEDVFYFLQNKY